MTRAGQGGQGPDFLHREFDKVGALWTELCPSVACWNTSLQYDGIWGLCLGDEQASVVSLSRALIRNACMLSSNEQEEKQVCVGSYTEEGLVRT